VFIASFEVDEESSDQKQTLMVCLGRIIREVTQGLCALQSATSVSPPQPPVPRLGSENRPPCAGRSHRVLLRGSL